MEADPCEPYNPSPAKRLLVGYIGTPIACAAIVENTLLFLVLASKRRNRRSHFLYLILLSLFDMFISAGYLLVFSVFLLAATEQNLWLINCWLTYLRPVMAVCHVANSISTYMIVAASFERFLITARSKMLPYFQNKRICGAVLLMGLAGFVRGTVFWEIEIISPNCTGMMEYKPDQSNFSKSEPYKTVFKFWFRNIMSVILPFFLCLFCNLRIICVLRKQHVGARLFRFGTTQHKNNIRAATRLLLLIAWSFMCANLLNVIITCWEFIDHESLYSPHIADYYTMCADIVSVLTIVACAIRLPIYYWCNENIRHDIRNDLRKWICCCVAANADVCDRNSSGEPVAAASKLLPNGTLNSQVTAKLATAGTPVDQFVLALGIRKMTSPAHSPKYGSVRRSIPLKSAPANGAMVLMSAHEAAETTFENHFTDTSTQRRHVPKTAHGDASNNNCKAILEKQFQL